MESRIKQEKGITMIALVITVMVLLILVNVLVYNAQDTIQIQVLNDLYSDIELLRDKVSEYYNEYGSIPAEIEYTNIKQLKDAKILSDINDTGKFYVIDLEAMKGISLNYGKEYENVKNDKTNANNYTDVYIINKDSHNIFYAQGVGIKQNDITKIYYTDYTEPDNTTIDLRYIDEILIPDGYYYIGKYNNQGIESIVISSNKNEEIDITNPSQYIWEKQIAYVDKLPDTIVISEEQKDEFIKSINHYKGYFKNVTNNVVYLPILENKWSEVYTKNGEYTDKNGDIAYIPKGFRVSIAEGTNEVINGLVITDEIDNDGNSIGNEFVWVPVNDFYEFERDSFGNEIIDFTTIEPTDLKYYEALSNGRKVDENEIQSVQDTQKMYKSIKTYKGFYIGRYETGIEGNSARTSTSTTSDTPVVKKNKYIYNYIPWGDNFTEEIGGAVGLAKSFTNEKIYKDNVTSTLCYGVQWDAIMKWINKDTAIKYVIEDSSTKGNYNPNGQLVMSGNYEEFQTKNIYDLAGNVSEWTMESYGTTQKVLRGGNARGTESEEIKNITNREANEINYKAETSGFRIALYINE
ncbi:MAG: SUMF1/EgtB/PvdO family nonheme iron enzyme [Clostridia bacterium]|jgi:type II secretory pathway pseudopilin PulG|nr:SUMF1/EgtB/PvdO family nonheme iron enzyme [Clostridia bacterium]